MFGLYRIDYYLKILVLLCITPIKLFEILSLEVARQTYILYCII